MINRIPSIPLLEEALAKRVIGVAMKVHRTLGGGFVESVYAHALILELGKAGIQYEREKVFSVGYDGIEVGVFHADLVVEDRLIVELKSVEALNVAHSVQLVNYLAAARIEVGLLLNFGPKSLEFKTKSRIYHAQDEPPNLQS
jgi:GxxExxY protein